MFKDSEIFRIFVVEARELIESVEPQLIKLQALNEATGEANPEMINAVFRLFHSLKGSAGSLGLENVASLTHKSETLLDLVRIGKARLLRSHVDIFLKSLDLLRQILEKIDTEFNDKGFEAEIQKVKNLLEESLEAVSQSGRIPLPVPGEIKIFLPEPQGEIPASRSAEPSGTLNDRFVQESMETLDSLEKDILETEKSAQNPKANLHEINRKIHGFKGNCGFMGFSSLERLAHKMETALESILENDLSDRSRFLAQEDAMVFLMAIDSLRKALGSLKNSGPGEIEGEQAILGFLDKVVLNLPVRIPEIPQKLGEILVQKGETTPEKLQEALGRQQAQLGEILVEMGASRPEAVNEALRIQEQQRASISAPGKTIAKQDVRVDLKKLDKLINLVGELVIAEVMVSGSPDLKGLSLEGFDRAVHQLHRVISELQDVAMSVRMVPLSMTFQKLLRVVHDLSAKLGKRVQLEILGETTEVDKTMVEQISDPLLHMVRNAIDHGIESIEERRRAGKPETGKVTVEGRHEGGEVWITISDDGKGLNPGRILAKAVEKGIFKGNPETLTEDDIFKFIFEPGFSTAESISEISGRGVGMDVVKRNIEKLKGRVSIQSKEGRGTKFHLQIPLTLAIIDGMLIRVGDARFTLPILSIRESLRPAPEIITRTSDGNEMVRIRDEFIPVVRLHKVFSRKPDFEDLQQGILVIAEEQKKKIAIFVDEILGQQQTVIKGLSDYFGSIQSVSGCSILGDGVVSLILDINGLIQKT